MIVLLLLLSVSCFAAQKKESPIKTAPAIKPQTNIKEKHRDAKKGKHLHVVMQGTYTIQPKKLFS